VTQFIDECLREWKRLAVADAVANEMAAELEADLRDAEADGLSPEEVLGDGVFDARSFAVAWASERGVIPSSAAPAQRGYRTLVAAITAALAIVTLFLGIAVLTGRHTTQITIASASRLRPAIVVPRLVTPGTHSSLPRFFFAPARGKLLFPSKPIPAGIVRSGVDLQPVGWILVVLGLAGIAGSILIWRGFPLRRRYTTA
jgi:hypothetical protein